MNFLDSGLVYGKAIVGERPGFQLDGGSGNASGGNRQRIAARSDNARTAQEKACGVFHPDYVRADDGPPALLLLAGECSFDSDLHGFTLYGKRCGGGTRLSA